jgi:hypothetical protein
MMPGTPNGVTHEKTVGERRAVMRAGCADGEDLFAPPRQQDRLLADMSREHGAVCKGAKRHASAEVQALEVSRARAHRNRPLAN